MIDHSRDRRVIQHSWQERLVSRLINEARGHKRHVRVAVGMPNTIGYRQRVATLKSHPGGDADRARVNRTRFGRYLELSGCSGNLLLAAGATFSLGRVQDLSSTAAQDVGGR